MRCDREFFKPSHEVCLSPRCGGEKQTWLNFFMPLGLKSFPGVAEQDFRGGNGSGSDPNPTFLSVLSIKFLTHWVLRRKGAGHIGLSLYIYNYSYMFLYTTKGNCMMHTVLAISRHVGADLLFTERPAAAVVG